MDLEKKKCLKHLFEGFGETALDDPKMARDILTDAGIDPDRIAEEGAALARHLYSEARQHANAKKHNPSDDNRPKPS